MKWTRGIIYLITPVAVFFLSSYITVNVLLKSGVTVVCPDVRGQKIEEAKHIVEGKGLSLSVARYEPRSDVPYGYITVQKPEANITIRKGRVVNVLVSEGPQLVELPGIINESLEEAEKALKEKQLEVEKTVYVPNRKVGQVIAQVPGAGTKILEGATVTLFVGREPETYYLMPEIREPEVGALIEELDSKKIKYRLLYGKEEPALLVIAPKVVATPPKSIFSGDDNIIINSSGG
ncbi:MAG: PASTA domain-containing protein [Syntrophobacterales bacterium]|jgi:serine/threonine-protein kinase|nr:PASTA domain-containing protein [Syntrophobacterales bacterium]